MCEDLISIVIILKCTSIEISTGNVEGGLCAKTVMLQWISAYDILMSYNSREEHPEDGVDKRRITSELTYKVVSL